MWIKAGVDISRLNREIRRALPVLGLVCERLKSSLHISSTYEGNHGAGSLHYSNDAFDFTEPSLLIFEVIKLREKLGLNYDVVVEPDHIHIEYDPK